WFDCSSLPGCQLLVSSVKSCWVEIICSMMMRVWCPQKVSVRPDGSRMVVVARSLGWASHTIIGGLACAGWCFKCLYPRSCDGYRGLCSAPPTCVGGGLMQNRLNRENPHLIVGAIFASLLGVPLFLTVRQARPWVHAQGRIAASNCSIKISDHH